MSGSKHETFQSIATVFILENKTWIERGSGLVRFIFDLGSFALRLIIKPGTPQEFQCKLRPRIRSKGPRAYVVRAAADTNVILAVRFEREEDSHSFRQFVEKRDANPSPRKNISYSPAHQLNPYTSPHRAVPIGYAQPQQILYSNQYGNSPPNNLKTNYFWTCTACFQMVDPALTSCQICGSMRDPQPPYQANNQSYHRMDAPNYQQMQNPYAIGNYQQPQQQILPVYAPPPPVVVPKEIKPVPIVKLTSDNLEKHNKLYPTKRKADKEVLLKKLIIVNCQQAAVVIG